MWSKGIYLPRAHNVSVMVYLWVYFTQKKPTSFSSVFECWIIVCFNIWWNTFYFSPGIRWKDQYQFHLCAFSRETGPGCAQPAWWKGRKWSPVFCFSKPQKVKEVLADLSQTYAGISKAIWPVVAEGIGLKIIRSAQNLHKGDKAATRNFPVFLILLFFYFFNLYLFRGTFAEGSVSQERPDDIYTVTPGSCPVQQHRGNWTCDEVMCPLAAVWD